MRLSRRNFEIHSNHQGGLKVHELATSRSLLRFVDICYLQIGGNDISDKTLSTEVVTDGIMSLAQFLLDGKDVKFIVIGQLLRRQPWAAGETYNERVIRMNQLLMERCKHAQRIIFWRHRGFWDEEMTYLGHDGVHIKLTKRDATKMWKYLQSVKSAVLHASKQLSGIRPIMISQMSMSSDNNDN